MSSCVVVFVVVEGEVDIDDDYTCMRKECKNGILIF